MLTAAFYFGRRRELVSDVKNDDTLKYQRHFLAMFNSKEQSDNNAFNPL